MISKKTLVGARLLRDRALKFINDIYAIAINSQIDTALQPSLAVRVQQLGNLKTQFRTLQDAVVSALVDLGETSEFQSVDSPVTDTMETLCYDIRAITSLPVQTTNNTHTLSSNQHNNILPKIESPKFDGTVTNWRSFRDTFNSLVNQNSSIGKFESFHYLLSCLSDPALTTVKLFPLAAANYDLAWQSLSDRYENQRLLATTHLDKLFAFKPITHESLPTLNAFVNTFHENIAAIKYLEVAGLVGFLLFYLGSKALDSDTRQLFEVSISQNELPELGTLLNFVRPRYRILGNLKGHDKQELDKKTIKQTKYNFSRKSVLTTSMTSPKFKMNCTFCGEPNVIYRCSALKNLTVDKHREFVSTKNLCFSCLGPSYAVNACISKSSCAICRKYHHNF